MKPKSRGKPEALGGVLTCVKIWDSKEQRDQRRRIWIIRVCPSTNPSPKISKVIGIKRCFDGFEALRLEGV